MDQDNPMARRMGNLSQTKPDDPAAIIDEGLEALKHPSIPHEYRMKSAKVLLAVKHYAMKGIEIPEHIKAHLQGEPDANS